MNQSQIVSAVAYLTHNSRSNVSDIINLFLGDIEDALAQGHKVALSGFGTFLPVNRKSRKTFDLQTRRTVTRPSRKTVRFKPGINMRHLHQSYD